MGERDETGGQPMSKIRAVLIVAIALGTSDGPVLAATPGAIDEYQADSLRGMSRIALSLAYSDLPELAPEPGLSREALLVAADLQLRRSGVSTERLGGAEGSGDDRVLSVLAVSVNIARFNESLYLIQLEVAALQSAVLIRDAKTMVLAATWRTGSFGAAPRYALARSIRLGLEDQLNAFLNDYLKQNSVSIP